MINVTTLTVSNANGSSAAAEITTPCVYLIKAGLIGIKNSHDVPQQKHQGVMSSWD